MVNADNPDDTISGGTYYIQFGNSVDSNKTGIGPFTIENGYIEIPVYAMANSSVPDEKHVYGMWDANNKYGYTYTLYEKTAPEGYRALNGNVELSFVFDYPNSTIKNVGFNDMTNNGQCYDKTKKEVYVARRELAYVTVTVVDSNDSAIDGGVFTLTDQNLSKDFSGSTFKIPVQLDKKDGIPNGTASLKPNHTYWIKESTPPTNFESGQGSSWAQCLYSFSITTTENESINPNGVSYKVTDFSVSYGTDYTNDNASVTVSESDPHSIQIKYTNQKIKSASITIKKLAADTKNALSGAKLAIYSVKNGKYTLYKEWTTSDNPLTVEISQAGSYVLRELEAPQYYKIADDISFKVVQKGNKLEIDTSGSSTLSKGTQTQNGVISKNSITMTDELETTSIWIEIDSFVEDGKFTKYENENGGANIKLTGENLGSGRKGDRTNNTADENPYPFELPLKPGTYTLSNEPDDKQDAALDYGKITITVAADGTITGNVKELAHISTTETNYTYNPVELNSDTSKYTIHLVCADPAKVTHKVKLKEAILNGKNQSDAVFNIVNIENTNVKYSIKKDETVYLVPGTYRIESKQYTISNATYENITPSAGSQNDKSTFTIDKSLEKQVSISLTLSEKTA